MTNREMEGEVLLPADSGLSDHQQAKSAVHRATGNSSTKRTE